LEKLLRVSAKHFVAGAVFEKRGMVWCCTVAAPIIKYMVGMEPTKIKAYLVKKGWWYEWLV
jgi:hypothetical protein